METNQNERAEKEIRVVQNRVATEVMQAAGVMYEHSYRKPDGTLVVESPSAAALRLAAMGLLPQEYIVQLQQAGLEV